MADDNQSRQRFTPIGIRMRNFGRRILRHYGHDSSANITLPPQKPAPSWLSNTQLPLGLSQPTAPSAPQPVADEIPAEGIVDAQTMIERAERPARVQRQPQQQSSAPAARNRKPGEKWSPDTDPAVLRIWELHKDNMRERDEIRRKKRENFLESASEDISFRTRKRRAEVDYLETSALVDPVPQQREQRTPQSDEQSADGDEGSSNQGNSPDISLMRDADSTGDGTTTAEVSNDQFDAPQFAADDGDTGWLADEQIQRAEAFDNPEEVSHYSEDFYYEQPDNFDEINEAAPSTGQPDAPMTQTSSDSPSIQRSSVSQTDYDTDQPQAAPSEFIGEPSEDEWDAFEVPPNPQESNQPDVFSAQAAIDHVQSTPTNTTPIQRDTFDYDDQSQQEDVNYPVQDDLGGGQPDSQPQPAQWQSPASSDRTVIQRSIADDASQANETSWQSQQDQVDDSEQWQPNQPDAQFEGDAGYQGADSTPTTIQRDFDESNDRFDVDAAVDSDNWQAAPSTTEPTTPIQREYADESYSDFVENDSVVGDWQPSQPTNDATTPIQRDYADEGYSDFVENDSVVGDWQPSQPANDATTPIQREYADESYSDFVENDSVVGDWQPSQPTNDATTPVQREYADEGYSDFVENDSVVGDWQPSQPTNDATTPVQREYADEDYSDFVENDNVVGDWQPSQPANDATIPVQRDYADEGYGDIVDSDPTVGDWQPPQPTGDVAAPIQRDFDNLPTEIASAEWQSPEPTTYPDASDTQWQSPQSDATQVNQIQRSVDETDYAGDYVEPQRIQPAYDNWTDDTQFSDVEDTFQQPAQPVRAEWMPRNITSEPTSSISDTGRAIQRAVYEPASSQPSYDPVSDYQPDMGAGDISSADTTIVQRSSDPTSHTEPVNAAWTPQNPYADLSSVGSQPVPLEDALSSLPGWQIQTTQPDISAPSSDNIQRQEAAGTQSTSVGQSDGDSGSSLPQNTLDLYQALMNEGAIQPSQEPYEPADTPSYSGDMESHIMRAMSEPTQQSQSVNWGYVESIQQSQPQTESSEIVNLPMQQAPSQQISRAVEMSAPDISVGSDDGGQDDESEDNVDVGKLARDVYKVLRDKLRIERERRKR